MSWPARLMTSAFICVPGVVGGWGAVDLLFGFGNCFVAMQIVHWSKSSSNLFSRPEVKKYLLINCAIWCLVGWFDLLWIEVRTVGRMDGGMMILLVSLSSFGS